MASSSDKTITAYYSLIFPTYTFYLQTLACTIGRRTAATSGPSVDDAHKVDVDLGPLKSVSRLHAKIEYDSGVESFVISIIGRNGAWIDGVWAKGGSRVALGDHTQIQIASRIFQFVLPPPADDASTTPSPPSSSGIRHARSPSVDIDITSISSASTPPSHSPPPESGVLTPKPRGPSAEPELELDMDMGPDEDDPSTSTSAALSPPPAPKLRLKSRVGGKKPPKVKVEPDLSFMLPNSNDIPKSHNTSTSSRFLSPSTTPAKSSVTNNNNNKKRKKVGPDPSWELTRPKPEDMPPKPPFTYAQLIYRAIKSIGCKATLQEICHWIMLEYDYYKWCDGAWMSSVRHNLSSGKAFKKLERCGGDRGKGFFWSVDEAYEHTFIEQESKPTASSSNNKKKDSDSHLKRNAKGEGKNQPLPPPLTSTPLIMKTKVSNDSKPALGIPTQTTTIQPATVGKMDYASVAASSSMSGTTSYSAAAAAASAWHRSPPQHPPPSVSPSIASPPPPSTNTNTISTASKPLGSTDGSMAFLDPNARVPIKISLPPPSYHPPPPSPPSTTDNNNNNNNNQFPHPPMLLHLNTIYLSPEVFSHLTPEQVKGLEALGMQKSLEILSGYMARFLKERMRGKDKGKKDGEGKKKKRKKEKMKVDGISDSTLAPPVGDSGVSPIPLPQVEGVLSQSQPQPSQQDATEDDIVIIDDDESDPTADAPALKKRKIG